MAEVYASKNACYGDSFGRTHCEFGAVAAITRLSDKLNRLKSLLIGEVQPHFESVKDTCSDMAAYALMLRMEIEEDEFREMAYAELTHKSAKRERPRRCTNGIAAAEESEVSVDDVLKGADEIRQKYSRSKTLQK